MHTAFRNLFHPMIRSFEWLLIQNIRGQNGALAPKEELGDHAIAIARAAKRLNDLRERWLNSPEWTKLWRGDSARHGKKPVSGSNPGARKSRRDRLGGTQKAHAD